MLDEKNLLKRIYIINILKKDTLYYVYIHYLINDAYFIIIKNVLI